MKKILFILIAFVFSVCSDGGYTIMKTTEDESEVLVKTEYVCDLDAAFCELWNYCKEECEDNTKCHQPKECVRYIKLKRNGDIKCVCKKCTGNETLCIEDETEPEDLEYINPQIEKPYKPFYLKEELDGVMR